MNRDEAVTLLTNFHYALGVLLSAPTTPPATQPPDTPPSSCPLTLPAAVAGRVTMQTVIPWTSGARVISGGPLDDSNVWLCQFTTGAAIDHDVRLAGAEYGGGPIPRHAVLIRNRDNQVLATVKGASITIWATFNPTQSTGPLVVPKPVLAPQSVYTLAVWNDPGHGSGKMMMDLYL